MLLRAFKTKVQAKFPHFSNYNLAAAPIKINPEESENRRRRFETEDKQTPRLVCLAENKVVIEGWAQLRISVY